ncbi:MAG: hypothetical protein WDL87_02300 [Candidatus Omnitrophota bacterium]|jgi:hypothetical protein
MDEQEYARKLEEQFKEHEQLCRRCGMCCGLSDGDPCAQLADVGAGQYTCKIYDKRFGLQRTVSGKVFHCVPIRENLKFESTFSGCAYYKTGTCK